MRRIAFTRRRIGPGAGSSGGSGAKTARVTLSGQALVGSIVVLLCAWPVFAQKPADPAESAQGTTASEPIARSAEPTGRIDFVGHNVFGDAEGVFHVWRVVQSSVDLASPDAIGAVVEVDLASLDTRNADRDDHLRTADFFDVEKHPVATVRGHSAQALEPSAVGHPRFAVRYDVDLHGVQKSIDGEIEIVGTAPVVVEGGFTLLRTDFGIGEKPSRWNPMAIDDEVPVRFRIAFE
jgi:polyisoprenoid-binding protein YceI